MTTYKARFLYVDDNGDYTEGMDGGIFITDVQPGGSGIVQMDYKSGVIGKQLPELIKSDDSSIIVTVEWDGIAYDWNGTVTVNGVTVTNGQTISTDSRRFTGTATIPVDSNTTEIVAMHDQGTITKVPFSFQGDGPVITDVKFVNGYPGSQTEVKENDTFDLEITFDPNASAPEDVEIANFGAMKYKLVSNITPDGNNKIVITGTIDSTSNSVQALPARVRARNDFGSFGDYVDTDEAGGTTDALNLVNCNDLHPTVTFGTITYSSGKDALKNSETATIAMTTSNLDSIAYTSPTSELSITNPNTDESTKTVTRQSGNYNVSTPNVQATAIRNANDAHTTASTIVNIAHVAPVITVTESSTRFQHDPNGKDYTITIHSNQLLRAVPSITAPEGSLGTFSGSIPGSTFNATITIDDDDTNGTYIWGNLTSENLAGIAQTTIDTSGSNDDTYVIGGFVERDIYFDPQAVKMPLGTYVANTSKLHAVDKDLITMTFYTDLNDHVRGFSIVDSNGNYDATGNYLYWNDVAERESNTTGDSFIRIREDV
jgi:hypothetical protein